MQRRWLSIAFGISVALNLFFAGLFSARVLQHRDPRAERPGHGPVDAGPRRFRQRPRPFAWMSDAERDELRPRRRDLRTTRAAAEEALRAEPFDLERLRSALGDLRRDTDAIQASVHEYMLRRAAGMSTEERRRLADAQWGETRGGGRPGESGPAPRGAPR
jgi:uncharacterized membrane protein